MRSLSIRDLILGLLGIALSVISFSIVIRMIWEGWDRLIDYLVSIGFKPEIEYVLGIILFIISISLGLIQLKKPTLKRKWITLKNFIFRIPSYILVWRGGANA